MLVDYLEGRKKGPLTPDGWVFIADALVATMNSFDEQALLGGIRLPGQEPRLRHTYLDLAALDVRETTFRHMHRARLGETRLDDLKMAAFGASALIAKACEAGRIKSATRRATGGALLPLPSYKWGMDDPWRRFWHCQMDPQYPFALNIGHWIFFEQAALYAEIDAWRVKYGLRPNWTETSPTPQPQEAMDPPSMAVDAPEASDQHEAHADLDGGSWAKRNAEANVVQLFAFFDAAKKHMIGGTGNLANATELRVMYQRWITGKGEPLGRTAFEKWLARRNAGWRVDRRRFVLSRGED